MQPNWAAYLYPPGFILIAWVGCDRFIRGKIWLMLGAVLSVAIVTAALAIAYLQPSGAPIPYKFNPFRQSVGWEHLGSALEIAGYQPDENFLFGDKYQTTSLLSFYGPGQKRAYFFNLGGSRKNQFSYWPQMNRVEVGKRGFFVVLENTDAAALNWYEEHYKRRLAPYFDAVHFRGAYPLYSVGGKPVKYALIFEACGYLGTSPPESTEF